MDELGKTLDIYLHKYYHILVIGDFNLEINERSIHDSCNVYNLERLLVLKIRKTHPVLTFC